MKRLVSLVMGAWFVALAGGAAEFDLIQKETIQKSFAFADHPATRLVKVDNIDGPINVTGYDGRTVEFLINKTVRAQSEEKLQAAQQDVRLELSQKSNEILAYVDAPWRCRDGSINYRGPRHYGYQVNYEFQLKIPTDTDLFLRTVNHGDIKVASAAGAYDIKNINGGIEMSDIAGAGRAYALNGPVKVLFSRNPATDCYFGSLNGNVDIYFRPGLSADLRFKTFNGNVYTDFEVSYLPPGEPSYERRNTRFVYKSNRFSGARVGKGGPEIKLDAFNGNVRVLERAQ